MSIVAEMDALTINITSEHNGAKRKEADQEFVGTETLFRRSLSETCSFDI